MDLNLAKINAIRTLSGYRGIANAYPIRPKTLVVTQHRYLSSSVGDPDPHDFGPPGSFPFLIKVLSLSGLK